MSLRGIAEHGFGYGGCHVAEYDSGMRQQRECHAPPAIKYNARAFTHQRAHLFSKPLGGNQTRQQHTSHDQQGQQETGDTNEETISMHLLPGESGLVMPA
ncbi:hypothetical protein DDE01_05650 [Desulfovibrio desulfuricans]|nr:hypothetical protein DDE01_05650 [Desulfovibrio desulfuricans]